MNNRRQFIERCALTSFGLSVLPNLSNGQEGASGFGSAKRIIFLNAQGGMSHIDTFDPKEGSVKGPGETISTSADFQVTEYLKETAKIADQISVIRTMTSKIGVHGPATYFMRTAYAQRATVKHPNLGAWAEHYLGASHDTLPSSACINNGPRHGNGFFPPSYSPIPILDPESGLQNIKSRDGSDALKKKLDLAQELSTGFLGRYPDSNVKAYQEFYDNSIRLLRSEDLAAFDLTEEPKKVREQYGSNKFGQGCLLARRLVEAGIRYVEVSGGGWDMHQNLEAEMEETSPPFDQAYATLITDLKERGLLDSTLVVLATEFGRKSQYDGGGRGHYPICFSTALAGAGIKRGFVYGESDKRGEWGDKPVTVGDFHATIGHAAGIPLEQPYISASGRPFVVGDKSGEPVMDLFA
ncbi:MAG: DUF1501 domain-containing protein [Verrucomicrobiota bacterium]